MARIETIVAVKAVKMHAYDETQRETAIYAKSDKRPGYRWYVGYGGDYIPANRGDLDNLGDYTGGNEAELADAQDFWPGRSVYMYRRGN